MKTVFVFRHGKCTNFEGRGYSCWSPDRVPTDEGKAQMRAQVCKYRDLLVACVVFTASVLARAGLSLCEMVLELGKSPKDLDSIRYALQLWSKDPNAWCTSSQRPEDMTVLAAYQRNPEAIAADGMAILDYCQQMCEAINPGQAVLCVSHGGPVDAAGAMARFVTGKDGSLAKRDEQFAKLVELGNAEGLSFNYSDGGMLLGVEELRS